MIGMRAAVIAAACCAALPAHAQLYTGYVFGPTSFLWSTCGSLSGSSGCFDGGVVNGFGNLCAAMEDRERPNTANVSNKERIYLMDNNATGKNDVVLHVLEKKIVVNGSNEVTSFTPLTDLPLPSVLGAATCLAAENRAVIVVGSNAPGSSETIIDKKTLAILPRRYTLKHGTTPGVTAITSDASGYISVNSPEGFFILDPNGHGVEEGGGTTYVIPDGNALVIP